MSSVAPVFVIPNATAAQIDGWTRALWWSCFQRPESASPLQCRRWYLGRACCHAIVASVERSLPLGPLSILRGLLRRLVYFEDFAPLGPRGPVRLQIALRQLWAACRKYEGQLATSDEFAYTVVSRLQEWCGAVDQSSWSDVEREWAATVLVPQAVVVRLCDAVYVSRADRSIDLAVAFRVSQERERRWEARCVEISPRALPAGVPVCPTLTSFSCTDPFLCSFLRG